MPPSPANFVQPYSTGASLVYLGLGGGKSKNPLFFGTCEGYPRHERRPEYMQLMNDISGRRKPMDMSYQGADATLALNMTVWDEGMAAMLERIPDVSQTSTSPFNPGTWGWNEVGVLMGLEQLAIPIWIRYTFAGTRPSGGLSVPSTLLAGYHYFQAIPFAPTTTEEGAQPMMRQFMFYVWPVCNFVTQTFSLFDNIMTPTLSVAINGPAAA